jgi:hypothetical protein
MAPNMWQTTQELAKRHEQESGHWLKLQNDNDKAVVVFLGEPFPREVCFLDGKYVPFDEPLRAQGHKPTLRIAINVALLETKEVKVIEQGVMFFKDPVRVRDKYGLDKWAFEVQRHGAAKDPKTSYTILPEVQLTVEQRAMFQALAQHDLAKLYAGDDEDDGEPVAAIGSYDQSQKPKGKTIELKVAQSIATELKLLPRAAVDRFIAKFGVQRIRDLPGAQVDKALAFIEQLQTEFAVSDAAEIEVDPFA